MNVIERKTINYAGYKKPIIMVHVQSGFGPNFKAFFRNDDQADEYVSNKRDKSLFKITCK